MFATVPRADILQACGVKEALAVQFSPGLITATQRFGILTREQIAGFIAQCLHESAMFTKLEEDLHYSAERLMVVWPSRFKTLQFAQGYAHNPKALGNYVYANRKELGNGDEASGDGYNYRGSGLIGLTGRLNFAAASRDLHTTYISTPDVVRNVPADAALASAWFWYTRGCNTLMSAAGCDAVSRKINGGDVGLKERRQLYERCFLAFGF